MKFRTWWAESHGDSAILLTLSAALAIEPASNNTNGDKAEAVEPQVGARRAGGRSSTATSFLVIGLILAMGGFGLTFYLGTQLAGATPTVAVLVAARDIPAGSVITTADLTTKKYLSTSAPASALHQAGDAVGRAARVDIAAGDPMLPALIGPASAGVAPASLLPVPAGYVAISLPATDLSAAGGFIVEGSFVDVIATANLSTFKPGTNGSSTRTVLASVEVVRVGSAAEQGAAQHAGATVLTVLVDGCDAQYVIWLLANASLSFAALPLRHGDLPVPDSTCPGRTTTGSIGPAEVNARYHFVG